jgi:bifunctional non-homologous end joining protein LigD
MTTEADASTEIVVGGRRIRVTNPDRVLWPETGFTKAAMLDYYLAVADAILPHLRGRGITLRRFPEGVDGPGWYQANCRGRPPWVSTHDVRGKGGEPLRYCLVEEPATLAWLANLGTIELHPFLALAHRPDEPTALVLDLDPGPPASLVASARVALILREFLAALGLAAVVKTSGSLGMHVYAPLAPGHTFEATKGVARALAELLAKREPDLVVNTVSRSQRAGRVFIDWVQNDASRSTVAPYSLRATPWPLVSTPLTWDEVREAVAAGRGDRLLFAPREVLDRIGRLGDPFEAALSHGGTLPTLEDLARDGLAARG